MLFNNNTRTVLFGGRGMLGRAFGHALVVRDPNAHIVSMGSDRADFRDPELFERTIDRHVSFVVNCAAYTDVDGAEVNAGDAFEINGHAAGRLARRCGELGVPLLHVSSDYVFGGESPEPYAVDAPPNPVNVYGESKLLGEQAVAQSGADQLTVRTSWLYASWGTNFVRTMLKLAVGRDSISVVADQFGSPSSATHVASTALALFDRRARGTFHACDAGTCSRYDLARFAVASAGYGCGVTPCTTAAFPTIATRPGSTTLDLSKTESLLGPARHWHDEVETVARAIAGRGAAPARRAA